MDKKSSKINNNTFFIHQYSKDMLIFMEDIVNLSCYMRYCYNLITKLDSRDNMDYRC